MAGRIAGHSSPLMLGDSLESIRQKIGNSLEPEEAEAYANKMYGVLNNPKIINTVGRLNRGEDVPIAKWKVLV